MSDCLKYWRGRSKKRKRQVLSNIQDLKDYKTLLYVGANKNRIEMVDVFYDLGYEIDVLEVWEPNVQGLIELNESCRIFRDIIMGDILDLFLDLQNLYDIVLFWHGPEHIKREFLPQLIINLESYAKHYVIMAAPIGRYEQPAVDGNPYEIHETFLHPHDFEEFGYSASCIKKKKARGSNMVLWRKVS